MNRFLENNEEIIDDYCDLDASKICDSCGKCLESDKPFNSIQITKIILEEEKDN